jgi:hypothetical protein
MSTGRKVLRRLAMSGSSAGASAHPKSAPAPTATEVNVSKDPTNRYGEPEIAVNPKNPNNLVYAVLTMGTTYACQRAKRPVCAAANSVYGPQPQGLLGDTPGFSHVRVYASFDGGKSWKRSTNVPAFPPQHPQLVERGDPLITAGPDGTFYLGWDDIRFCACPTTIIDAGGIAVSKSTDGGRHWSTPVLSGTAVDRPFFAADLSTGTIYEASTGPIGANSKGDPSLPKTPIGGPGNDRMLVASKDGVHWSDPKPFGGFAGIGAFGSAAQGVYATAFTPTDASRCGGTVGCLVFQTTTDQGATWSRHPLPVPPGSSSSPLIAADPTTRDHFAIAVLNAAGTQFLVFQTKDAGTTWTGPTTVTDDASKRHFHAWLAYSPKGVLGLMWQTNVNGGPGASGGFPAAVPEKIPGEVEDQAAAPASPYRVWAAISTDGGTTFSAALAVSKRDSPAPQTPLLPFGIGDDFSFVTLSGTHAYVAWADYRPGDRQAFFSAIDLRAFKRATTSG